MAKLMFTGSDVLFATRLLGGKKFPTKRSKFLYFLGYTIFVKICDLFVECFYVVSEHLISELKPLKLKSDIKVLTDPPKAFNSVKKIPHKGFNILYYRGTGSNQVFYDWVYGYDIVKDVVERLRLNWYRGYNPSYSEGINLIEVNGNNDLNAIYPIIDVLIRPNRHDGAPRMIMECEQIGIPYYWSKEDPKINDMIEFITKIVNDTL